MSLPYPGPLGIGSGGGGPLTQRWSHRMTWGQPSCRSWPTHPEPPQMDSQVQSNPRSSPWPRVARARVPAGPQLRARPSALLAPGSVNRGLQEMVMAQATGRRPGPGAQGSVLRAKATGRRPGPSEQGSVLRARLWPRVPCCPALRADGVEILSSQARVCAH